MTHIDPESIKQTYIFARVVADEARRHGLEEVAVVSMMRGELDELLADSLRAFAALAICDKAGCMAFTDDPLLHNWHLPTESDTRNGHNMNASTYCPEHWAACLQIGFTL